jgi:uncharacterized membrane protein YqiK
MTGQFIGQMLSWLIAAVVVIAIIYWVLNWLYRRTSKETAFVRTGFLGEKVVIDAGAFVWPIIHNVTLVNMNTLQLEVRRGAENALITRDRMRVDVVADFYVRVRKSQDAVSIAATTLGQRTLHQEQLHGLLQGKFISALREVAASMELEEIHEQRSTYVARVKESAHQALAENGLELESVAIVDIDQTGLEYFNPSNRFDAEGLTKLIDEIESRRKIRNDIEQDTAIKIRNRNLETEKRSLEIELESEMARLQQQRDIEANRAAQAASIAREQAEKDAESKAAEISAAETVEKSRITQERAVSEARIKSEIQVRKLELEQRKQIEEAEIATRESVDLERISQEAKVAEAEIARDTHLANERIASEQQTRQAEIARNRADEEADISAAKAIEQARISQAQELDAQRIQADRTTREAQISSDEQIQATELKTRIELDKLQVATDLAQDRERIEADRVREVLDISREQAIEAARVERTKSLEQLEVDRQRLLREAEIGAREEVERVRIASERGLDEARISQDRDRRSQEINRDQVVETAQLDKAIAVYQKSLEEAAAQISMEEARARVAAAEEAVRTTRATEEATRRSTVELTLAEKDAAARKIAADGDRVTAAVTAEAQRLIYEAENILTDEARQSIFRRKMLEHVEGIVSASVKPMEKISEIKIMHLGGDGGASGGGSGGGSGRNTTDEVIDSALRYRVQAPMIDNLLSEIGIEGGSLAKMGGLIREAKDLKALAKGADGDKPVTGSATSTDKP